MENKNITVRKFTIPEEFLTEDSALQGVSLVQQPAHQSNFLLFNSQNIEQFKIQSEEKKRITGVAILPFMHIYRLDSVTNEPYYGYFEPADIERLVLGMFKHGYINNFSMHHNGVLLNDIKLFESFIVSDTRKDSLYDVPNGSWIITVQVESEATWNKIKEDGLKGFSIEAYLDSIEAFGRTKQCNITTEQVTATKLKKLIAEAELDSFKFSPSTKLEKWSKKCACKQCTELRSLGWNLPGILPDAEFKKQIGINEVK